jgi:hypothetical protein
MHGTRLIAAEAQELRRGGEAVITRLGDILVIQAIRTWLDTDPAARSGRLGALKDRQIGRALALVHRDPARDWTVASLAGEVAMAYVARWRMHPALDALNDESRRSPSWSTASATAPKPPSAAHSSASSGPRRALRGSRLRRPELERAHDRVSSTRAASRSFA